ATSGRWRGGRRSSAAAWRPRRRPPSPPRGGGGDESGPDTRRWVVWRGRRSRLAGLRRGGWPVWNHPNPPRKGGGTPSGGAERAERLADRWRGAVPVRVADPDLAHQRVGGQHAAHQLR